MAVTTIVADILSNTLIVYISVFVTVLVAFLSVRYYKRLFKSSTLTKGNDRKVKANVKAKSEGFKKEKKISNKNPTKIDGKNRQQSVIVHPWSLSSLKGHISPVLGLDLSSNGKYIASCAEDQTSLLAKMSMKTQSQAIKDEELKWQKKNSTKKRTELFTNKSGNCLQLKMFNKLGWTYAEIYKNLLGYVVARKKLKDYGFPTEFKNNTAYIEPKKGFSDSNQYDIPVFNNLMISGISVRTCCRCHGQYVVCVNGEYLSFDPCVYHWGKQIKSGKENVDLVYSCCNGPSYSPGCTVGQVHVSPGPTSGYMSGFVKTNPSKSHPNDDDFGVYALDCEMCYTTRGLDLVKVSLVRPDGSIAYNELVNPEHRIVDYNTRFSGITEDTLKRATKSLKDVQIELLHLIKEETILIGHSLENDLRALKLVHANVVDTSIVFPHFYGLPYRRSLKSLISSIFKKDIQTCLHNSVEDARASLELILWKLKKDLKSIRTNVQFDYAKQIKWSPDSKAFIITLANENTIQVFKLGKKSDGSLGNIQPVLTFPPKHENEIIHIAIASSGKYILSCSNDTTIKLWNLKGSVLSSIDNHQVKTFFATISPCGRFIGSSGFTADVKVWEIIFNKNGDFKEVQRAFELKGHGAAVYNFSFNCDSTRIATVSKDGTWRLWATNVEYIKGQDPYLLLTIPYPHSGLSLVALSPDTRTVAVSSECNIYFYSGLTGKEDGQIENAHEETITSLMFDQENKFLISSGDKIIRIFHNVVGYRETIKHLEEKRMKATGVMRDRIFQQINEAKAALKTILDVQRTQQ